MDLIDTLEKDLARIIGFVNNSTARPLLSWGPFLPLYP